LDSLAFRQFTALVITPDGHIAYNRRSEKVYRRRAGRQKFSVVKNDLMVEGLPTILCRKDGSWKEKLKELLEKNPKEHVTLLAIGEVKTDVLQYLNRQSDLHIIRLETRYMKQRRKGLGLKVQVIKKQQTSS